MRVVDCPDVFELVHGLRATLPMRVVDCPDVYELVLGLRTTLPMRVVDCPDVYELVHGLRATLPILYVYICHFIESLFNILINPLFFTIMRKYQLYLL